MTYELVIDCYSLSGEKLPDVKIKFDLNSWFELDHQMKYDYDETNNSYTLNEAGEEYTKTYFSSLLPLEAGETIERCVATQRSASQQCVEHFTLIQLYTNKRMFVLDWDDISYQHIGKWCGLWEGRRTK